MAEKKLNEKQEIFLNSLFGEAKGDLRIAKLAAGYAETYSIPQIMKGLEDEIERRTKSYIALHGPKAAMAIIDVVDTPATLGNGMRLSAAKDILDRANITKTDRIEIKTDNPLFILPEKTINANEEEMEVTETT